MELTCIKVGSGIVLDCGRIRGDYHSPLRIFRRPPDTRDVRAMFPQIRSSAPLEMMTPEGPLTLPCRIADDKPQARRHRPPVGPLVRHTQSNGANRRNHGIQAGDVARHYRQQLTQTFPPWRREGPDKKVVCENTQLWYIRPYGGHTDIPFKVHIPRRSRQRDGAVETAEISR